MFMQVKGQIMELEASIEEKEGVLGKNEGSSTRSFKIGAGFNAAKQEFHTRLVARSFEIGAVLQHPKVSIFFILAPKLLQLVYFVSILLFEP